MAEKIHLGGQTRTLEATPNAINLATAALAKLGVNLDPRMALLMRGDDFAVVCIVAACLLEKDLGKKASPKRLQGWLIQPSGKGKFPELAAKAGREIERFYIEQGIVEPPDEDEEKPPGEAESPSDPAPEPATD